MRGLLRRLARGLDRLVRFVALAVLVWTLAVAVPAARGHVLPILRYALSFASERPAEARRRVLGPRVAAVYDRLRREIPPDGGYLLVDGGTLGQGGPNWVRFELAPRRAYLVGTLGRFPSRADLLAVWPDDVHFGVIAKREGIPPVVLEKKELLALLWERDGRR